MPALFDVSVISSGHDVADARLHRQVGAMVRAGLRVEVLGLGDSADAPQEASRVRVWRRGSQADRMLLAATLPNRAAGRVSVLLDPDLLPAALARRAVGGPRVVADVHEDYAALLSDRAWVTGPSHRLLLRAANWLVRQAASADLTVVADEHVPPLSARNRLVARNLPDLNLLPAPGPRGVVPRAVYVGDLRRSRGLFEMIEGVAGASKWELDLVGPVAAADRTALEGSIRDVPRVRWHGRLPPAAAWRLAEGAWVGLSLLQPTPAFLAAMPSKVFEYAACGLAVIVSDLPRQADFVTETGCGVVVGNDLAQTLGQLLADDEWISAMSAAAVRWREALPPDSYSDFAAAVAALAR